MWPFQTRYTVELEKLNKSYDYIIVGAGSAGCVLANRLSQDPSISVLVLERGGLGSGWKARVPLLSSDSQSDGTRSKKFGSVPQPALGDKPTEIIIGNALGGCSKINGMIYARGLPSQFKVWSLQGRNGWSYDDLHPYFLRSEGALNKTENEKYHNLEGELKNRSSPRCFFASAHNVIKAAKDLNFPYIKDLNSPHEPVYGIAKLDHNIDENGRRSDTASAFLPDSLLATLRDRLHVCVNALVTRLELETSENGTLIAKGVVVECTRNDDHAPEISLSATKEVILCAGALGTPHILMLSGIGPRQHLMDIGIKVRKDLPGVGGNLQDHMGIPMSFRVPLKDSIISLQKDPRTIVWELSRYLLFGTGMFLCPLHELSLFVKSEFLSENSSLLYANFASTDRDDPKYLPDIELMTIAFGDIDKADKSGGGFSLWAIAVQPFSRGTVRLKSKDPRENPLVDPNLLGDPRDRIITHKGIKLCLKIKERMAANGYSIEDSRVPKDTSVSELDRHIVEWGQSIYHYTSTCRMAPEDDTLPGVVDDELRVHGIKHLRIVDTSVFPNTLPTHFQATVIAMAEKLSDLLKQDTQGS